MIYAVCSVRDSAMAAYMPPFQVPNTGVAVRSFRDEVNKSDSPMFAHPEDYELYHLGYFSDETGKYENLDAPAVIARAKDFKQS